MRNLITLLCLGLVVICSCSKENSCDDINDLLTSKPWVLASEPDKKITFLENGSIIDETGMFCDPSFTSCFWVFNEDLLELTMNFNFPLGIVGPSNYEFEKISCDEFTLSISTQTWTFISD